MEKLLKGLLLDVKALETKIIRALQSIETTKYVTYEGKTYKPVSDEDVGSPCNLCAFNDIKYACAKFNCDDCYYVEV